MYIDILNFALKSFLHCRGVFSNWVELNQLMSSRIPEEAHFKKSLCYISNIYQQTCTAVYHVILIDAQFDLSLVNSCFLFVADKIAIMRPFITHRSIAQ